MHTRADGTVLKAHKDETPALPVRSPDGSIVGRLEPIDREAAGRAEIVTALHDWRKAHMTSFLTVFEPSLEKTRHYLDQIYLPDFSRILFLVRERNRPIGHLGFNHIDRDEAELDNVLRGEVAENPQLMHLSQIAALAWVFGSISVRRVVLNVLIGNTRAIRSYKRIGFISSAEINLMRVPTQEGYVLTPGKADTPAKTPERLLRMELGRTLFEGAHGWALKMVGR